MQVWNGFLLEKSSSCGVCCCLFEAFPPEHGAVAQGGRAASLPRSLREQPGLSPARHPRNTREQLHLMARDSRSIPGHHVMIRCHFRDPRLLSFGRWKLSPKSARCSREKAALGEDGMGEAAGCAGSCAGRALGVSGIPEPRDQRWAFVQGRRDQGAPCCSKPGR